VIWFVGTGKATAQPARGTDALFSVGWCWTAVGNRAPESPDFGQLGKNLPRYPKKGWEVVEIAGLYDNAIIIEYLTLGLSR
jgi:hypothetical protein